MGRPIVLSNGEMFIGLNNSGLVHDFYYPYIGLDNLNNARMNPHKIGLWVDGNFSWVDDGSWDIKMEYEADALISNILLNNNFLGLSIVIKDLIDPSANIFIRRLKIINNGKFKKDVRLFMHQVFELSDSGRADTALFVPDDNFILDYKGKYSLAISGKDSSGKSFDQWAVGNCGIENKLGTYVDATDGELSLNPVEHGEVDSVIRFKKDIEASSSEDIDYWVISTSSQYEAANMNKILMNMDIDKLLADSRDYWQKWIHVGDDNKPDKYRRDIDHSLMIIKAHIDDRGSVLASGDSSIFNYGRDYYCYCWPRDAAYGLWPLIRLGHYEEAKNFFEFARDTMHKDGYLMHKYQPDRTIGSTWHPLIHGKQKELAIQEDETATVVFMIGEFYKASGDKKFIEQIYHSFVSKAANFMCSYIDQQTGLPHASYDLWEEKFLTSTYTVSTVISALKAAALMANDMNLADDSIKYTKVADSIFNNLDKLYNKDGYYSKGFLLQQDGTLIYDNKIDISSLYGVFAFSGLDITDYRIQSTIKAVEKRILNRSPSGGVIRYEYDGYYLSKNQYPGNPWGVTTLLLSQVYIANNEINKAKELLDWAIQKELSTGAMSEQYDPEDSTPIGVTPLVWSQAQMINTILDLKNK